MLNLKEEKDGISLKITVVPNSAQTSIIGIIEGVVKIKLNSPPIEGKANKEVIEYFSRIINVPKTSIKILKGEKNKHKTLFIKGNTEVIKEKLNCIKF
jgi:uncharacterized protein (TIGR00251 family)